MGERIVKALGMGPSNKGGIGWEERTDRIS